jgi:hypothetical protein
MRLVEPLATPIKRFPVDWPRRSLDGKRQWLMASGQAANWSEASSLLSRHGAAVKAYRKRKATGQGASV